MPTTNEQEPSVTDDVEVPVYDPGVHTLGVNEIVRLEVYCECGGLLRWGPDPVSHVLPQLRDFETRHHGPGHGPTTAAESLAEREARREAGFRAAGRQHEYEPKEHDLGSGVTTEWTPTPPPAAEPDADAAAAEEAEVQDPKLAEQVDSVQIVKGN